MKQDMNDTFRIAFRAMVVAAMTLLAGSTATAQVHVSGNVYGGGNLADVGGSVTVNMTAGTVDKDVYGGGALANTNTSNTPGTTTYTTTVNLKGGTIEGNAYGGGLGRKAKAAVDGQPAQGTEGEGGYVPAVPAQAAVTAVEALVYGNVTLKLNEGVDPAAKGCVVKGKLFGCNNVNGTPKGNVEVHVYATQSATTDKIQTKARNKTASPVTGAYDVVAVYGGGNEAAYVPTTAYHPTNAPTGSKTQVIIEGCDYTSIETVYGGGNAAAVPESNVQVLGAYEIGYVYGGGNGKDNLSDGTANPGADIGQYNNNGTLVTYGTGIPSTTLTAGYIHEAYGGSNQKGVIKGSINLVTNPIESGATGYCCDLALEKVVGAGKYADIEGDVILVMGCMPESKTAEIFGGADEANVKGNVELTITSGTFGKVFGGNNLGGAILGHIILNIEETGCHPIKIDELYLGGNQAAYSIYGYYDSGTTNAVGKPVYLPRTSESDEHPAVTNPATDANHSFPYAQPVLNVISCTYIGKVFGGGYGEKAVLYGDPTVNINMIAGSHATGETLGEIVNAFGGGNAAKVEGNTTVNIGTATKVGMVTEPTYLETSAYSKNTTTGLYEVATQGANITGNVFGGGNKADVSGNTFVNICAVLAPVPGTDCDYTYTSVDHSGTTGFDVSIGESVYGGGSEADVNGNTRVTMTDGYVFDGVYGGGLQGSVGTFTRAIPSEHPQHEGCVKGKPDDWTSGTGKCTVVISGGQVGPVEVAKTDGGMKNTARYFKETDDPNGPVDVGFVFGAGRGEVENPDDDPDADFHTYVKETEVTISGTALIMASVYGGGENGRVRGNTKVKIEGGQIGCGVGMVDANTNKPIRYTDEQFIDPTETVTDANALAECASWDFAAEGKPYDPLADKPYRGSTAPVTDASTTGSDGHTYYGSVFGGGSGYYPYEIKDASNNVIGHDWLESAGLVEGNTEVVITGGHILTSVYGGNELTNVTGSCTINMVGGTVGVPRTVEQAKAHPVTCYVFGAGKGDQRINFNTWTNVGSTQVNISGNARVYGSTFGGGEDGHVLGDVQTNIGGSVKIDLNGDGDTSDEGEAFTAQNSMIIGTTGTSGVDGNIFGGGRGFSETALTAGVVGGNVDVNIYNGTILGTVFGGGRLASVGTFFADANDTEKYGKMQGNLTDLNHGVIRINISGGTIGAMASDGKLATSEFTIGDVFGGSKGSTNNDLRFGLAKHTFITMTGGKVKGSVYGGGEVAVVEGNATIAISGGEVGDGITKKGGAKIGNVFGGGKGNTTVVDAGLIKGNTMVTVNPGSNGEPKIYHNIYGGGAYGSVGTFDLSTAGNLSTYHVPYAGMPVNWAADTGTANVTITGGTIGTDGKENGMVFGSSRGDIAAPGEIHDKLAWVNKVSVTVGTDDSETGPQIKGSVYGSGENGHTYTDTEVTVYSGTIGIANSSDPGYSVTSDGTTYSGAEYPYRGNVYGGGCGTDKYYSGSVPEGHTANDGEGNTYNSLAGIVYGTTTVTIDGGHVIRNVYGAGAMGSVGKFEKNASNNAITFASGGKTTIAISGGTIGVDGTKGDGNVFGAARGDKAFTDKDLALVKETGVTISGSTSATQIKGNVYGGGEVGNVHTNTAVDVQGGAIARNVFGGGKGVEDLFTCEQAMVGVDGEGACQDPDAAVNKNKGTVVTISNGTVGTLNGGTLVQGTGNVYGGGEIGRVEWNTQVTIGSATGTSNPLIYGSVFGAGKGLDTHGYSALVRGNSTVIVQGGKVLQNVYGGGEKSTVGRYWVKNIPTTVCDGETEPQAPDVPEGMPYQQRSGGICKVTIQGSAQIGPDAGASANAGHVFGAGKGVNPSFTLGTTERMVKNDDGGSLVPFTDDTTLGKTAEELYLEFLQTLALVTNSNVTIDGSATVKGSVYGGSESGFVQHDTKVEIKGGTVNGDAFGGGLGLASFAEAGKVKGNTDLTVSGGAVQGNVYGGGSLGDVGVIDKTEKDNNNKLTYNYYWKQSDGVTANAHNNNTIDGTNNNTGICKVTVSGGTIGIDNPSDKTKHGNVFGAGRGSSETWWCEKAIVYATDVIVSAGTVKGNVYGGGEVGRVEDDAKVTIGNPTVTDALVITGDVFGAGAGLATHGYSALVRGNSDVIVQGKAQVGGSVYGGGETASVGKFDVVGGLPTKPKNGGTCTVKILGDAKIGSDGTGHNIFGACKGVTPVYNSSNYKSVYSMQLYENRPSDSAGDTWEYYTTYDEGYTGQKFIKRYYKTEQDYLDFLKTLALTSNTHVTVGGSSSVYGSVYGGGERGVTLGGVDVNVTGGTVNEDVYGGGALADTNTAMWDADQNELKGYVELPNLIPGSPATGYYTTASENALITDKNATVQSGTTYYANYKTTVNLTGGTIRGNAYGGGLGQKAVDGKPDIAAMVYGDVLVELNNNNSGGPANGSQPGCSVYRVFGCNNLNGTPKGKVKVHVFATQSATTSNISTKTRNRDNPGSSPYDVDAVYGGGNLSPYIPVDAASTDETVLNAARSQVIIDGCDLTSIRQVYGGGNAASVPATFVEINGTYEIDEVFGGGNGKDNYSLKEGGSDVWYQNPGANVGYFNYTILNPSGTSPGTVASPYYLAVDDTAFDTKEERLADNSAAAALRYGSGIARLEVYGGTIHTSYGGSNLRGNVRTLLSSVYSANGGCTMAVGTSYGGGNLAESDGKVDMVADCAHGIKEMFGGSKNADVDNDINLKITNGSTLERVFGGNNTSGAINGSITVTIEEGGCEPIRIDNLYIGGYLAPYSVYGYKKNADGSYAYIDKTDENGNPIQERIPLMKGDEGALEKPRQDPCLNVVSASYIGNIFGGGYQAKLVGNPHVNVNMKEGKVLVTRTGTEGSYVYKDAMGNAYTNVTSETTGEGTSAVTKYYAVLPLGEIGNIYGGGNMADVIGDTHVEIGTGTCVKFVKDSDGNLTEVEETLDRNGAKITGNVFGGGKGKADTFLCEKAMIGKDGDGVNNPDGGTHVTIGNGTVDGNVYGGGEIGRVEKNTVVTIGLADAGSDKSKPVIKGSVFGGGKGEEEHGYAALVRGNPTVIIQADAKVEHNVYGGGEIASVARYNVPRTEAEVEYARAQGYDAHLGMPYALANTTSGNCKVTVKDNAIIGPDKPMKMYHPEITDGSDVPDDAGHVFGAGKGVLPKNYTYVDKEHKPKRMVLRDETIHTDAKKGTDWDYVDPNDINNKNVWEYFADRDAYIIFIQTLALSSYANVIIGDDTSKPFVKGSVYGGSENGLVQFDTKVYIKSGQIGCGKNATAPYGDDVWADGYVPTDDLECASWDYGIDTNNDGKKDLFAPYDPNANATGDLDKYPPITGQTEGKSTEGGRRIASDGHTYYGNVFGGGSGSVPYFDTTEGISKYLSSAGTVKGDTYVEISGGHILTNVYGGCESTNVLGTAKVTMKGGTLGVPRTPQQIKDHPVTCYLFGAGKGDQRIYFNKETNVNDAIANVEGGRIYGSVFGGGEDGHVLRNTSVTIGKTDGTGPKIGTVGSTYVDGNVFGGGRGFGGEALTSGNVGGSVDLIINGGTMLGSIYGGGRLASVGYGLYQTTDERYRVLRPDNEDDEGHAVDGFRRGHITVTVNGGTIGKEFGADVEGSEHSGNVFGGSMGRLAKIDGSPFDDPNHWALLATAKTTTVNVTGGIIRRNVYGGGEMGTVVEDATVTVSGGTIGKAGGSDVETGNVFGGGKGYLDPAQTYVKAGIVKGNTHVTVKNGTSGGTATTPAIHQNVYGGGELGFVGVFTTEDHKDYSWTANTGLCEVGINGGTVTGHVFGAGKGMDDTFECERAMVRATSVSIGDGTVGGNVYGGGEVGRVDQNSAVTIGSATGDSAPTITGSVFGAGAGVETHGYSALVRGNTAVIVQGNAKVGNSVYGGGQIAAVGRYGLDSSGMPSTLVNGGECVVTVQGNAVIGANGIGNVFGAGMGVDESKKTYTYADNANRPKRMMTYASGLYTDANKALWEFSDATHTYVWEYFDTKTKYLNFLQTLALATDTRLTINGNASVNGSVYGGSESGFVQRYTDVRILGGKIQTIADASGKITEGNVFGGGKGISDNDAAGRVRSDTKVTVLGGTVYGDVYGGGALGKANTLEATNTASVNLLGGVIEGNAFGGGLGNATTAADVGNTRVNLNGMTDEEINGFSDNDFKTRLNTTLNGLKEYSKKGAVVKGSVFGANNVNGTPKGHVLVHVYATQNKDEATIKDKKVITSDEPTASDFDVTGVFGGGKQADYVPELTDAMQSTEVIIEGCDLTSIYEVYGGGYGAATPGTNVLVKGTKIINNVFGGGYGAGNHTDTSAADYNPGANVGFRSDGTTAYGSGGKAVVQLMAGTVNHVYGGSNTLGNIRGRSNVTSVVKGTGDVSPGCCDHLTVLDIFGGGKSAEMFGGTEVVLGCMPDDWIGAIYAGAEAADVHNDVSLTLTSGKFERVFGGNKSSGTIDGYIEVNIEENPECSTPIIIGGLYGGGNMAPYAVPAKYTENNPDYLSPRVNVRAFTSIGNIYGGGFGATATVTGNPLVNINVVEGGREYAGEDKPLEDGTTVTLHARSKDAKMGVIGNVFGGGNAAKVIGNPRVEVGTAAKQKMLSLQTKDAAGTVHEVEKDVLGADIRGNVYGGGNNAEVGHTNVVIGKKAK